MILPISVLFILLFLPPLSADPGYPDTVRVGSITILEGEQAVLSVYFYNDEALTAVEIVLDYDTTYLVIDSFSLEGGRLAYIPSTQVFFRNSGRLLNLAVQDWNAWIPRGNGLLCNLFFSTPITAGGHTVVIDSSFYPPVSSTIFSDSVANTLFPQFVSGQITINNIPFTCGDASGNTQVNILDVSFIINFLYKGGPSPYPINAADVSGNGIVNILDVTYLINFLYKNGPALKCPQ
jgi:hypothetical protein